MFVEKVFYMRICRVDVSSFCMYVKALMIWSCKQNPKPTFVDLGLPT